MRDAKSWDVSTEHVQALLLYVMQDHGQSDLAVGKVPKAEGATQGPRSQRLSLPR